MTVTVAPEDLDAVFDDITSRLTADQERRIQPGRIYFRDGNMNLRGICGQEISATCTFLNNDVGTAQIDMPLDYYLSKWLVDVDARGTINVHVDFEKDGARWSGRMDSLRVTKDENGRRIAQVTFKHDLAELQKIIAWSNPWLPLIVQWPRVWMYFARAITACKMTLFTNLCRLFGGVVPKFSNPLSVANYATYNMSDWPIVVAPNVMEDKSAGALIFSRFKTIFECTQNVVEDAQLTWSLRRWYEGDPEPWPGANLRHGALVVDLVDKSGWTEGTAFSGNLFEGFLHEKVIIGPDGMSETTDIISDPNMPDLYSTPGAKGTDPAVPAVIFREGDYSGIQTSEFEYRPPTHVWSVGGGHSAPFVNGLISAAITMAGNLTAMIPGVPPIGGVLDAVLKPLYTDVLLAFSRTFHASRAARLGGFHYLEGFAEGSDRAYTLSWIIAMRTDKFISRETTSHTIKVANGAPFCVGDQGKGHFFIGDRIGSTVLGMPPGKLFVDRVSELTLSWDRDSAPEWEITIGARDGRDPVLEAFKRLQQLMSLIHDLGLV